MNIDYIYKSKCRTWRTCVTIADVWFLTPALVALWRTVPLLLRSASYRFLIPFPVQACADFWHVSEIRASEIPLLQAVVEVLSQHQKKTQIQRKTFAGGILGQKSGGQCSMWPCHFMNKKWINWSWLFCFATLCVAGQVRFRRMSLRHPCQFGIIS